MPWIFQLLVCEAPSPFEQKVTRRKEKKRKERVGKSSQDQTRQARADRSGHANACLTLVAHEKLIFIADHGARHVRDRRTSALSRASNHNQERPYCYCSLAVTFIAAVLVPTLILNHRRTYFYFHSSVH